MRRSWTWNQARLDSPKVLSMACVLVLAVMFIVEVNIANFEEAKSHYSDFNVSRRKAKNIMDPEARDAIDLPKSLDDEVYKDILYYNRVPKTGSENLVYILQHLAKVNSFTHLRFGDPTARYIDEEHQVGMKFSAYSNIKPFSHMSYYHETSCSVATRGGMLRQCWQCQGPSLMTGMSTSSTSDNSPTLPRIPSGSQ